MLSRGQKKRTEALGDLWECWGALAEARGKPTDSVLGKRKQPGAWAGSTASSFCEASRTAPPLGSFHWQLLWQLGSLLQLC